MSDIFAPTVIPANHKERDRFVALLRETKRGGIESLIAWLNESDFYSAPASTRFHGAVDGGLLSHSLAVYDKLTTIASEFSVAHFDDPSLKIVALLHDICKANFYTVSLRNAKNEKTGQWEKVPYYTIEDQRPYGHGEKSVDIIRDFIDLTIEERMAIRWHMGGYDDAARQYGGAMSLSAAMGKYPLICALHMADLAASWLEGK